MASLQEARSVKAIASEDVRRRFNMNPVYISVAPFTDEGFGLKIGLVRRPPESVPMPDHIAGVPVRYELSSPAVLLPGQP